MRVGARPAARPRAPLLASHLAGIAVERLGDINSLGLGQSQRKVDVEAHDEPAPEVAPKPRTCVEFISESASKYSPPCI